GAPRQLLLAAAALCLIAAACLLGPMVWSGRFGARPGGWPLPALAGVLTTVLVAGHWPGFQGSGTVLVPGALGFAAASAAASGLAPGQRAAPAVLSGTLAFLAWWLGPSWWSGAAIGIALGGLVGLSLGTGLRHRQVVAAMLAVALSAALLLLGVAALWVVGVAVAVALLALQERSWLAVPAAVGVLVTVGIETVWPGKQDAGWGEQVVERLDALSVVYRPGQQELALCAGKVDIDLAGPGHEHAAMLAGLAASLTPRSARLVVVGAGAGRLDEALLLCGREPELRLDLLGGRGSAVLGEAMGRDGPLAEPEPDQARPALAEVADWEARGRAWGGPRREGLYRMTPGAADAVLCAEPLLGGQPWRASLAEQRAMRRAVGRGWVLQSFLMDRTPPELVASALRATSRVHPWTGLWLSGNVGVLVSGAAAPDWELSSRRFAALPEGARWLLHAAGLGDAADLELAFLGRCPSGSLLEDVPVHEPWLPLASRPGRDVAVENARLILRALWKPGALAENRLQLRARAQQLFGQRRDLLRGLTEALLSQPGSLLLWRECTDARLDLAEDQVAATDPDDPAAVAAAAALAAGFAHLGSPRPLLQAAMGLPDLQGQRLRSSNTAATNALAMNPDFGVGAPRVVQALLGAATVEHPLAHFAALPSGARLARLASGAGPLAVALRARFPSRCAAALVEQWGRGPLPTEQRAALRELVDPFVLAAAGLVLDARGARSELLQVFRRDLPGSGPLMPLTEAGPAVREALMLALAGRKDTQSLDVLAEGLLDDDLSVRTAAGAALFRSVGGGIDYDPQWPAARRKQAAARVRALQNRTQ
ncbi:MAG: hypothetical protein VYE77_01270, partial [Planctomycetota bacterium]|nr:hypothetical protein [Planctomycetota bacterium]